VGFLLSEFIHGVPGSPTWEAFATPGIFLLFWITWLFGGNHFTYRWDWMIPPLNGAGYAGIIAVLMWVVKRLRRLLAQISN
jgi:hypothetical protein